MLQWQFFLLYTIKKIAHFWGMLDALVLNIGRRISYHPGWLAKKGRRGSYPLLPSRRLPASQRLSPTVKAPLLPPLFPNTLPKKLQFVFLWGGFCHGYQTLPPPHKRGKKGISYLRGKSLSISSCCQLFSATVGYLTLLSMWDRGGCLHFRTNEIKMVQRHGQTKKLILTTFLPSWQVWGIRLCSKLL